MIFCTSTSDDRLYHAPFIINDYFNFYDLIYMLDKNTLLKSQPVFHCKQA